MRISDERKDKMPSTSAFVWIVPAFLFIAWLTKVDIIEVPRLSIAAVGKGIIYLTNPTASYSVGLIK